MKTCDVFTCRDEKASNHLQVEDSKQIKKKTIKETVKMFTALRVNGTSVDRTSEC